MRKYKLYKLVFPNNKIYVGITSKKNIEQRWLRGMGYKHCPLVYNAIQKYGWDNVEHIVILDNINENEIDNMEIEYISKYKSNQKDYGYNIENGGKGKYRMNDEIRGKISRALKGKPSWNKGKKLSTEHIKHLSQSHIGKTREKCHNAKAVIQYDLNMNFIKEFDCVINASEETNINKTLIARCARKECKQAGGFIWIYKKNI